jgi:hypothetical protein
LVRDLEDASCVFAFYVDYKIISTLHNFFVLSHVRDADMQYYVASKTELLLDKEVIWIVLQIKFKHLLFVEVLCRVKAWVCNFFSFTKLLRKAIDQVVACQVFEQNFAVSDDENACWDTLQDLARLLLLLLVLFLFQKDDDPFFVYLVALQLILDHYK